METANLTIDSIVHFQQWLFEKGRSKNTTKSYCGDVRSFWLAHQTEEVPKQELQSLVAAWLNQNKRIVNPRTSLRRIASLREYALWAGITPFLPGFKLPNPGQSEPHPLPGLADDLQRMLDHCTNNKQRCLIALLGLEGLRLGEALLLKVDDLDLTEMVITVWGKGDKVRRIPITQKAWPHLYPQIIDARLQNLPTLVPYSDRGARYFITELGCAAKISRSVASHDLRATFATLAYASSKDIRAVQAWLGHADITTTQIYVQVSLDVMRSVGEF